MKDSSSPEPASVDALRDQLRSLGYLSHGIERWFALDPWRSRTFWAELLVIAAKVGAALSVVLSIPLVSVMLIRNQPLAGSDVVILTLGYVLFCFVSIFIVVILTALFLRIRPEAPIQHPRVLLAISIAISSLFCFAAMLWWFGFTVPASLPEMGAFVALLLLAFLFGVTILSAALLSFSIHSTHQIPVVRHRRRLLPLTLAAVAIFSAVCLLSFRGGSGGDAPRPQQIIIRPQSRPLVLIAVDGLSWEIFTAQKLAETAGLQAAACTSPHAPSAAERWATVGTGTPGTLHGVRAIEGVRSRLSGSVLQSVSSFDVVLRTIAPSVGILQRAPLPPTARRRDYIWEIFASHGLPSVAMNWWVTASDELPLLRSRSQEQVFAAARKAASTPSSLAVAIDREALQGLAADSGRSASRFHTAFLPALDIVVNRIGLDASSRLAISVQALDSLRTAIVELHRGGYEVMVIGLPGDEQSGSGVIGSTIPLDLHDASALDIAPTVCDLEGFPASEEMSGRSLVPGSTQSRLPSFGARETIDGTAHVDDEYYQSLKSLGYIR